MARDGGRRGPRLERFVRNTVLVLAAAVLLFLAVEIGRLHADSYPDDWPAADYIHAAAPPPRQVVTLPVRLVADQSPTAAPSSSSSSSSSAAEKDATGPVAPANGTSAPPLSKVAVAPAGPAADPRAAERTAELEEQLRTAGDALGRANERVAKLGEERDALQAQLADIGADRDRLARRVDGLERQLQQVTAAHERAQAELETARAEVGRLRDAMPAEAEKEVATADRTDATPRAERDAGEVPSGETPAAEPFAVSVAGDTSSDAPGEPGPRAGAVETTSARDGAVPRGAIVGTEGTPARDTADPSPRRLVPTGSTPEDAPAPPSADGPKPLIIRGLTGSRDAAGEEIDLESTPSNVAEQRAGSARPSTGAAPSGDRTEAPARSSDADVATRETRADTSSADERVPSPPADPRGPAVVPGSMQAAAEAYHAGDYREAERIWRRLAEAGSPPAQFALGALLYEGRTGPVDRVEAYEWLTRAVERGHEPASRLREQVRDEMTGDELRAVEGASG